MIFTELEIKGIWLIEYEPFTDERGAFMRHFDGPEFEKRGMASTVVQANISANPKWATLRGFHYQAEPFGEAKTLSCISGAIFDVVIDLRPDSPTYLQHVVPPMDGHALHVPAGCANAWITTQPNTMVHYYVSEPYHLEAERGIRWNDPTFNVEWPFKPRVMSEKDKNWSDWVE